MPDPIYKRVMLKLSGEALLGKQKYGIDFDMLSSLSKQLIEVAEMGVELVVEIGGGNIYRWKTAQAGIKRTTADVMGMMGSTMNALNFESYDRKNIKALSSLSMSSVIDDYTPRMTNRYLRRGYVVVIGGGTGSQFFSTDTSAALHALQLQCEVVIKGTDVDGIYDSDPDKNKQAKKYNKISFDEILKKKLEVMDMTAFALCRENNMPMVIFNMLKNGNIRKVVLGEKVGTKVGK